MAAQTQLNASLTPQRRRRIAVVLVVCIAIGITARIFEDLTPEPLRSILSAAIALAICLTIITLVRYAVGWNWVTWTMVASAVCLEAGQILHVLRAVSDTDYLGTYYGLAFRVLDFSGLSLIVVVFFGVVFALHRAHEALWKRSQMLAREMEGREKATKELARSETQYREMIENVSEIIFRGNLDGYFTFANRRAAVLLGYGVHELVGRHFLDFIPKDWQQRVLDETIAIRQSGKPGYMEFPVLRCDGEQVWLGQSVTFLYTNGKSCGMQAVARDITERKEAELALRTSEERYRELVEATGVIPWEADAKTFTFMYIGPQVEEVLGYPVEDWYRPRFWPSILHPRDRDEAVRFCMSQTQQNLDHEFDYRIVTKDGKVRWFRDIVTVVGHNGNPYLLRGIFVDITQLKEAEEERRAIHEKMQHGQKLESLGVLAGGIAHDFNNLLAGILGNADLALQHPEGSAENLETIVATSKRAADLCQQLLAYSGRGKIVVQPHDITSLVGEMGDLLAVPISKKAEIIYDLSEDVPTIEGDGTQIRQIVLNLVTNATEAIEYPPGTITVTTGTTRVEDASGIEGDMTPGEYVFLDVTDSGCGMDERTLARMFDPFYSTKFAGRGLGLASVLGIMRGHGGGIHVKSQVGSGTTVRLLFPVSGAPLPVAIQPGRQRDEWQGHGTILVVDDEPAIRRFIARVIENAGFEVVTAADGAEAVHEFRLRSEAIAAVVLDLTMPNMDGAAANRAMSEIRRGVPTIVISGFSEAEVAESFEASGPTRFLQKPFATDELRDALCSIVETEPLTGEVVGKRATR